MIEKYIFLAFLALCLSSTLSLPVDDPQLLGPSLPIEDENKETDQGLPSYAPREFPEELNLNSGDLGEQPVQEGAVSSVPEEQTGDLETANTFWGLGYRGYGWRPSYYGYGRRGYGGWGGWGGRRGWGGGGWRYGGGYW